MNKKDDFLIRGTRNTKRKSHKRRNVAIAATLSVMCIAAMAGVYSMERQKDTKEELLVNWEDNATTDTGEKVKVNLGARETPDSSSSSKAELAAMDAAQNIAVIYILKLSVYQLVAAAYIHCNGQTCFLSLCN